MTSMDRWRGKLAVVTGAAAGIGAAITRGLLDAGVRVVGLDVQERRLKEIAEQQRECLGTCFYPLECDVGNGEELEKAFEWINAELGGCQIMVNNAGVISYSRIIDSCREDIERQININLVAMATCSSYAVKSMRESCCEGHVLNINSVLSYIIPEGYIGAEAPGWNVYPATKHGGAALSSTLRREISHTGLPIRVTSICPGLTRTGLSNNNKAVEDMFKDSLEPEDIADTVLYVLGTKPHIQVTDITVRRTGELI